VLFRKFGVVIGFKPYQSSYMKISSFFLLSLSALALVSCDRVKEALDLGEPEKSTVEMRDEGIFKVIDGDPTIAEEMKTKEGLVVVIDYFSDT